LPRFVPHRRSWPAALSLVLLTAAALAGCNGLAVLSRGITGDTKKVKVDAEYRGLDQHTIAVVVAADEVTLGRYPDAPFAVGRAIASRISDDVPGARVVDPLQIARFQRENPYWNTLLPNTLIQKLGVERMVLVDLLEYQTTEPGDRHVWQGRIHASVSVLESDAVRTRGDPDQPAYATQVLGLYPEETTIGVLEADQRTIELGALSNFARNVVRLFTDHTIEVKQ
jgi:hypothetical protein